MHTTRSYILFLHGYYVASYMLELIDYHLVQLLYIYAYAVVICF